MQPDAVCPQCGLQVSGRVCPHCNGTGAQPRKSRVWIYLSIAGAVLILLLIGEVIAYRAIDRDYQRKIYQARAQQVRRPRVYPRHQGPVADVGELKRSGHIWLFQMGPQDSPYNIDDFAYWLRTKYSLDVRVLPPMALDRSAWDSKRQQYIAELLLDQIEREHPALAADANTYLIGFTDADMYTVYEKWSRSFSQRDDPHRTAIISANGMEAAHYRGGADEYFADMHLRAKLRRILLKDIAVLFWRLPRNNDPTSLLHQTLDPDIPAEDIYESDLHPERTRWGQYESNPSIFFIYSEKNGIQLLPGRPIRSWWDVNSLGPDQSMEVFQIALRFGTLLDRHTDFYLPDTIPIRFQRVTMPGWTASQAFGVSGTDNYDKSMWTHDNMRHITFSREDGTGDKLVRIRSWFPILPFDRWVDADDSGRLLELRWRAGPVEHFDLMRFDGTVESYLPCDNSTVCYEIGFHNNQAQKLLFLRDTSRRLVRLTSPNKSWIRLSYGSGKRIAAITDSRGRTVQYGYNKSGQLVSVAYPSGETYYYEYDRKQQMLTFSVAPDAKTAPRVVLRNEYENGRLSKQTLAGDRVYTYSYAPAGAGSIHSVRVTEPGGAVYEVDMSGWDATIRERASQ